MNNLQEKVIRSLVDMYGFHSTEELSEMIGVSVNSIKNSLEEIGKMIEGYDAKLLRTPRKGICLVATEVQRESILEELDHYANTNPESFYYRRNYILDTLFNYPGNYTMKLFSEELFVSRNIIQKDLESVEQDLNRFHLELSKRKNQGLRIVGSEFDLRQAIVDTQNKKYWKHAYIDDLPQELDYRISKRAFTFFSDYYEQEDIMMVQKLLAESEKQLRVRFVDIAFCRITEYLLLTQRRIREGKKITEQLNDELMPLDKRYIEVATNIFAQLFPKEQTMDMEYQYLAAKLFVSKICEMPGEVQEEWLMDAVQDYVEIVFTALEKESAIRRRELEKQIATYMKKLQVKHSYGLVEWDDLHKDIQVQLQGTYAICLTYAFQLEEKLGFVLTQDEIAWCALLIHQASVESRSMKQGIFVTATDRYTSSYEAMKIESDIDNLEIVKVIHIQEFQPEEVRDKIVISTVPLKEKLENAVEITKHVSQQDINKVENYIDDFTKSEQSQKILNTVRSTFGKDLISIDVATSTKKDTIMMASQLMQEQGYLSEDVTERVYELEKRRPTTIGNQIAMAHIYKESVIKSGIAIVRLKYPVQWSNTSKIKLLFFIAINYEGSREILLLFKYLYSLIDNKEAIEKILKADSNEEIYQLLMKEIH